MQNPWPYLPTTAPYVLDQDCAAIENFNANASSIIKIRLELLPEPFLGNVRAPVVLLALNPGYSAEDTAFYAEAESVCRNNLNHALKEYPFYLLAPAFAAYSGPTWWRAKLRWLIKDCGLEKVATNLCCIEYFPYHSARFNVGHLSVGSQQYSFSLVRQAVQNEALIVIMRAENLWLRAVPELKDYAYRCKLRNAQRAWLSPGNFAEGWYDRIAERLRR